MRNAGGSTKTMATTSRIGPSIDTQPSLRAPQPAPNVRHGARLMYGVTDPHCSPRRCVGRTDDRRRDGTDDDKVVSSEVAQVVSSVTGGTVGSSRQRGEQAQAVVSGVPAAQVTEPSHRPTSAPSPAEARAVTVAGLPGKLVHSGYGARCRRGASSSSAITKGDVRADPRPDPLDRNRPNLLGLRLRVVVASAPLTGSRATSRISPRRIGGQAVAGCGVPSRCLGGVLPTGQKRPRTRRRARHHATGRGLCRTVEREAKP